MEKKLTLARAVLSFCAATMLLALVVGSRGVATMAKSINGVTLIAVADSCPECDPPPNPGPIPIIGDPPKPGPIPIVGDPPKPKPTPPSVSIVPCIECEPRPIEGEPMPLPAPIKKEPPYCLGCDPAA